MTKKERQDDIRERISESIAYWSGVKGYNEAVATQLAVAEVQALGLTYLCDFIQDMGLDISSNLP